jgi:hypothetical protein
MQARERKMLIETAGKDYVGACIDSGNAVWTIEDPHLTLEVLAPYVLTSHMRDSYVFNAPDRGTAAQWCRMGDGNLGIEDYIRKRARRGQPAMDPRPAGEIVGDAAVDCGVPHIRGLLEAAPDRSRPGVYAFTASGIESAFGW